jgi:hypothetical protein
VYYVEELKLMSKNKSIKVIRSFQIEKELYDKFYQKFKKNTDEQIRQYIRSEVEQ